MSDPRPALKTDVNGEMFWLASMGEEGLLPIGGEVTRTSLSSSERKGKGKAANFHPPEPVSQEISQPAPTHWASPFVDLSMPGYGVPTHLQEYIFGGGREPGVAAEASSSGERSS